MPADPPVVGSEVVAPVRDAVGLVDDEQPDRALDRRAGRAREVLVRQPLGRDQQDVDLVGRGLLDLGPLVDVAGVDRHGPQPQAIRGLDLVAHQREQRADDERRPVAGVAADAGRDPVDEALAPAGPLHNQRRARRRDRLDLLALALAEGGGCAEHRLEVGLEGICCGGRHASDMRSVAQYTRGPDAIPGSHDSSRTAT